jgi:hypothetical protein
MGSYRLGEVGQACHVFEPPATHVAVEMVGGSFALAKSLQPGHARDKSPLDLRTGANNVNDYCIVIDMVLLL